MFKISNDQMLTLGSTSVQLFEDELVEDLKEFAPKLCEIAGEPAVRSVIQMGMERAEHYGFTNRGPTRFYIELMFSLGCDFDTDPLYGRFRKRLTDNRENDQTLRADLLYDDYVQYVEVCVGDDNQILLEAIRRCVPLEPSRVTAGPGDLKPKILDCLKTTYPEKYLYCGPSACEQLVDQAMKMTAELGAHDANSKAISTAAAFLLGHRYDQDPLYAWISKTLKSDAPGQKNDVDAGFERLASKGKLYIGEVIRYWEAK